MWNRKELKERAKAALTANYWKTVVAAVIMLIVSGGAGAVTSKQSATNAGGMQAQFMELSPVELVAILIALIGSLAAIGIVAFIFKQFVLNPLSVGCQKFFKENAEFPADLGVIGGAFREHYGNVVLTMFLKNLFLGLWTMLFIIPGIVKFYSYRMVPFILAENPDMSSTDIITKSRDMMRGHKLDTFILDLSFLGWLILSCLTAGILGVFYVNPYILETNAELYLALKEN